MKKTYVTVTEFLENGGVLESGRKIYIAHEFGYGYVELALALLMDMTLKMYLPRMQ